jgi:hypothetical protein
MARTQADIEKEYQDTLRVSQSLIGNIQQLLDSSSDSQQELLDAARAYNRTISSTLSDIDSYEGLLDGIVKLEREKADWLSMANDFGREAVQQEMARLDIAIQALKTEQKRLDAIKMVDDVASELSDNLKSGLDDFQSNIKSIPVFGNMLSSITKGPVDKLKGAIGNTAKTFVSDFGGALRDGKTGMQALSLAGGNAGGSLMAAFAGPQAIIAAIVAVIAAGVFAFYKITAAAKQFREQTGLLNSQTKGLDEQIQRVAMGVAPLGGSMEDVAKAAAVFSNEFDGLEMASDGVLTSMVALNKNFGVSIEGSAKLNKMFTSMSDMSSDTAQQLINTTAEAAKLVGVSPNKVIEDMAGASEEAYNFFNGSPQALAKAAVEAAKLGTSIQQATSVARGLLDFESSITAELEASAMLGTRINFNKARALAADKDALGAQKAVVDEVAKLGDLSKISVYEMESLAKAAGMPIADLQRQIDIRQNLGELEGDQLKAAMQMLDAGKAITDISKEDLDISAQRIANQREMQSEFDNMGNELKAMGTEFLLALAPIGKLFVGIIKFVAPIAKGFFDIIGKSLGRVFAAVDNLMAPFKEIFGGESSEGLVKVLTFVGEYLGRTISFAIGLIARLIDGVANTLGGIWKIVKGIFTLDFGMIWDGIKQGLGGILEGIFAIPLAIYDTFVDLFDSLLGIFGSIGAKIKAFIMDLVPDWVKNILSVGGSTEVSTGSVTAVNDAVISPSGDVISTSPKDFLIATQNPGELGGGKPEWVNELITAFKETKDVYMDGKKVTAGVSNNVDRIGSNSYSIV